MSDTPRPTSSSTEPLAAELRRFGAFRKRWSILHGLAVAVLVGPGALLAWFLIDWAIKLPAWPLVILFLVAIGLLIWGVAWRLLRPMLRPVRIDDEAVVIEALHGKLDNRLIGSLQLDREVVESQRRGASLGYSSNLVAALVRQTTQMVASLNVTRLIDLKSARQLLTGAAAVGFVILLCVVFAHGAVAERFHRLADAYAAVLDSLFPVDMRVTPGNVAVVRGRPVTLAVDIHGARRREVKLIRSDLKTKLSDVVPVKIEGTRASLEIARAEQSFTYRFEYAGRKTEEYKILVGDLPEVSAINYELAYPAYTGQPSRTLSGRVPRLQGLSGTGVLVSFAATTDLHPDSCYVQWQDGSKQQIPISGRFGHFSFTVARPDRATIYLTGAYGKDFRMEQPIGFEVAVQADEPPNVKALVKLRKVTMEAEEAKALVIPWLAEDDFGVSEVNLEYRIDTIDELLGRPTRQGSVPRRVEPSQDRVKGQFAEMFKTLQPPLQPGDRITITVSAKDNNTETGPGLGKSLPIEIVVVQPDLAGYVEAPFGFNSQSMLAGLQRVKRATELLIDPEKTDRTEKAQVVDKQALKSRVSQENFPSGNEDAVGDYLLLLSGGAK